MPKNVYRALKLGEKIQAGDDQVTVVVQVNGKKRGDVQVAPDADEATVTALALRDPNVAQHTAGKTVKKSIFIKNRLLNLVAEDDINTPLGLTTVDREWRRSVNSKANDSLIATATTSEQPWKVYTEVPQSHFDSIDIGRYRALGDVRFEKLGRVNLVVGINNAGKTSVLDAVYLLANQSDPRGLLELLRRRSRMDVAAHPAFSVTQLPREVVLSGHYDKRTGNDVSLKLVVKDEPEDTDEDWASYLRTLIIDASYAGRTQRSVTDFFAGRARRTRLTGEPRWLTSSVFHSPFSLSDPELLVRCYEESIRLKLKNRVVDFIRTHIDMGIRDVTLANEHRRFLVTHTAFDEAVDLSSFGEGIQRVFLTGLLFAGARGGVVLIDEFENALHTGLLFEFTKFVHELAVEFECQVFLTTHSKETIDAFLLNAYRTEEIVAYLLKRENSATKSVVRFSGPDLKRAVEVGDVDLRRL